MALPTTVFKKEKNMRILLMNAHHLFKNSFLKNNASNNLVVKALLSCSFCSILLLFDLVRQLTNNAGSMRLNILNNRLNNNLNSRLNKTSNR